MADFRTVSAELRHEVDKVKGSRFIGTAIPVGDEASIEAALERVRTEFRDATHNCWAWRLGRDGGQFRYSDDGEPSGSAGRPMLQQIDGRTLTNTLVIVTRFYGGTKLGVGGLMRAYGGCAAETLDLAEITTVRIVQRIAVRYRYELSSAIQRLLAATDLEVVSNDYGAEIHMVVDVPEEGAAEFVRELRESTSNQVEIEIIE